MDFEVHLLSFMVHTDFEAKHSKYFSRVFQDIRLFFEGFSKKIKLFQGLLKACVNHLSVTLVRQLQKGLKTVNSVIQYYHHVS